MIIIQIIEWLTYPPTLTEIPFQETMQIRRL